MHTPWYILVACSVVKDARAHLCSDVVGSVPLCIDFGRARFAVDHQVLEDVG